MRTSGYACSTRWGSRPRQRTGPRMLHRPLRRPRHRPFFRSGRANRMHPDPPPLVFHPSHRPRRAEHRRVRGPHPRHRTDHRPRPADPARRPGKANPSPSFLGRGGPKNLAITQDLMTAPREDLRCPPGRITTAPRGPGLRRTADTKNGPVQNLQGPLRRDLRRYITGPGKRQRARSRR